MTSYTQTPVSGDEYTNPAVILKAVLEEHIDRVIDVSGFDDVETAQDDASLLCGFAETEQITLRGIVTRFATSFNMTLVQSRDGKLSVTAPGAYATANAPHRRRIAGCRGVDGYGRAR